MADETWDLINGPLADEIEVLNRESLMNVTAALVKSLLHRQAQDGMPALPDEGALRLLHRTATQFLLARPGEYRDFDMHVAEGESILFQAQPWPDLKRLMRRFFRDLAGRWSTGDALDVAAYALWRLTWLHPFSDGNGRTAIAFAYACLCAKLGAWLPGTPTVVDLIRQNPDHCRDVLRDADRTVVGPAGEADLAGVKCYLDGLLLRQMQTVEAEARRP